MSFFCEDEQTEFFQPVEFRYVMFKRIMNYEFSGDDRYVYDD